MLIPAVQSRNRATELGGNWVASRKIGGAVPVVLYCGRAGSDKEGGTTSRLPNHFERTIPGFSGRGGDRNGQHMYAAVVKVVSSIIGLSTRGGCRWFPGRGTADGDFYGLSPMSRVKHEGGEDLEEEKGREDQKSG
jgi:hypothetical protein